MRQMFAGAHGPVARRPFSAVQAAQVVQSRPFQGILEMAKAGVARLRGQPEASKEEVLVSWVKRNGGQADVRIATPQDGGPRGVLAERAFAPDEVIISLPQQLTIPFEGTPEEACILLLHIFHSRGNQFRPWLNMLPGPEDFIAWDTIADRDLAHLQCAEMERALAERKALLEAVWQDEDGPVADAVYSREMLLGSIDLDWDDVQWAANIVRSRTWTMGETEGGKNMAVMKPLLDMLNHNRSSPNEMRFQQGAFQLVHRGPGILAGEEITYSYEGRGHELRADQAAMDYSFMLPSEDDPRLFHIDALASQGQPLGNKMDLSRLSDEGLQLEREHMSGVLEGFPTTMSMDEETLAAMPETTDERGMRNAERFLIEVRAARKAALKRHLSDVNGMLERRRQDEKRS